MTTLKSYFALDVDDEPIPLIDGAYVPPAPAPAAKPETDAAPRLHPCRVLLALWCIAFVAMLGASYIYVLIYPLEPADHIWQAIPIGVGLLLPWLGVTFALHKCARRHR